VPTTRSLLVASIVGILLLFYGLSALQAQDLGKPILLVATPSLKGPYANTALIAVPVGDRHVGFILNRATELTLSKLFPQHEPSAKVVEPVYFGGPAGSDALFALVARNPGKPALHLFGDLYVTNDLKSVDRIIEETPNDARYMVGFVGWQPGELAHEMKQGYWFTGAPEAGHVFTKDTKGLWDELVKRYGKARPGPGQVETNLFLDRLELSLNAR
jgi:putative transcriptional regulator